MLRSLPSPRDRGTLCAISALTLLVSTPSHGTTPSYRELADEDLPYTEIIREGYRATGSVSSSATSSGWG